MATIDPAAEEAYWRQNYAARPYVPEGASFGDYGPAYRYGVDTYARYGSWPFTAAEPELMRDWQEARGSSMLTWEDAKHAARDTWERLSDSIERATPGDSDRDGR